MTTSGMRPSIHGKVTDWRKRYPAGVMKSGICYERMGKAVKLFLSAEKYRCVEADPDSCFFYILAILIQIASKLFQ